MSMSGMPQGRGEVGETVASFPSYEAAQKAVSTLIAGDIPAKEIAIVGSGLRSIERVTGRLGYATAARSGAINGLLLGLFFSAIFVLGNPSVPISAFVGVLFVGIAFGMLLSLVTYALVRRRRDYASVMQVVAEHYDVTVLPSSIHRARQIMGSSPVPAPRPETTSAPMRPAPRPEHEAEPRVEAPRTEPPRYGERIAPDGTVSPEEATGDEPSGSEDDASASGGSEQGPSSGDPDAPGPDRR
jgi:hypothetical protein